MKLYSHLRVSAILGLMLISAPAQAVTLEEVPNPRDTGSWVSDSADLLNATSEAQLNQLLTELEAKNGTEMTVVTVTETAPAASPKAFTTSLFNRWGVGKAEQDNGVVFVISKGDRRAEVVVGYGLESVLTQSKIEALLNREAIPDFKQGDYDRGIIDASEALVSELTPAVGTSGNNNTTNPLPTIGTEQNSPTITQRENQGPLRIILAAGGGIIALAGVLLGKSKKTCDRCNTALIELDKSSTEKHLSKAQSVASRIGSASYIARQCPSCSDVTIDRRKHPFSGYKTCDRCQEPTIDANRETLQRPTRYHSGEARITRTCQCCDYTDVNLITLARLSDHSSSSHSSGSSGASGGGFGGGSSGGSGGGASW